MNTTTDQCQEASPIRLHNRRHVSTKRVSENIRDAFGLEASPMMRTIGDAHGWDASPMTYRRRVSTARVSDECVSNLAGLGGDRCRSYRRRVSDVSLETLLKFRVSKDSVSFVGFLHSVICIEKPFKVNCSSIISSPFFLCHCDVISFNVISSLDTSNFSNDPQMRLLFEYGLLFFEFFLPSTPVQHGGRSVNQEIYVTAPPS
jgi:hypothetical protein